MTDFISELERELRAASTRRLRLAAARLPRPPATAVTAAVSAAVCVAVVLAVLQAHGPRSTAPSGAGSSVAPQIVSNFAPFRRARTLADRLPARLTIESFNCFGPQPRAPEFGPTGPVTNEQVQCAVDQRTHPVKLSAHDLAVLREMGAHQTARQRLDDKRSARTLRVVLADLQRNDSRRESLPDALGTMWLVPSGRWLCDLTMSRRVFDFPGHAMIVCEPVRDVLTRPPLWAGLISDGYYFALEPDKITNVALSYPGGSRATVLHDNVLSACVGLGRFALVQRVRGRSEPITTSLGGIGRTRLRSCPGLHG